MFQFIHFIKKIIFLLVRFFIKPDFPNRKRNYDEYILKSKSLPGYLSHYKYLNLDYDKKIVLDAIKHKKLQLNCLPKEFCNDEDIVLQAVKNHGIQLIHASDKIKNNKMIVLVAVKSYGKSLKYASDILKNDRDIVTKAISNNIKSIKYVSESIKTDKKFILNLLKLNKNLLYHINPKLKKNRSFNKYYTYDKAFLNFVQIPKTYKKLLFIL